MQPTKKYMRGENMRVLLLLRGSAGCGKSTWIEQNGLKQYALSADNIRMMCSSPQMMPDGTHAISQANDNIVWKTLFNILETRMKNGEFTVIDATNSKTSEMNRYKKMCDEYRYRIYCVDMTTVPIEVTKERNRGRQELKRVPEEVIDKMYARFETQKIPSGIKVIQPDELNAVFMKKFNLDQYKRIHHIGDIHGCNTALNTYFEANGGFKDDEFYIFCGDYTDRGIENADVLKFLLSTYDKPNVLLLEGNHERWLWDWAHDKVTASKEFEFHTKAEIEAAGIDKKSIRKLYRRMGQCAYYEFRGKTVLATHAGLSMIPDNLTMVSTSQMIKGVGRYNDAEQVDATFEDKMDENCYQIHGHRNTKGLPVKVNNHAFNLEGRVEFGGSLRAVILDNDGTFNTVEVKNTVFREPEEVSAGADSVGEWILELRRNKYIKEKQYGDISSFNFTKTAFYDKIWDEQTTKARGLYIDIPKQKIVARAYDKFFNINERPETELDKLQDKLSFPVRAYIKENGYLGIVSNNPETGKLFVTTKSNPDGEYAEWFDEALHTQLGDDTLDKINAYCKSHDVSFVFENVDMERDPHIIKYPESRVFLLDIVSNDMKFQKLSFEEVCAVAESFKIPHKELGYEIETWQDFFDWYNMVMDEDYKYDGRCIEGFVIEDSNGYMVKLKLAYYNFWKFMRSISHEAIKKGYIDPKRTAALVTPLANQFYAWVKTLHDVEDLDSVPRNICTLRDMFYESDSGKKFKDE